MKSLEPGHGNGNLPSIQQFDHVSLKLENGLKNLDFVKDLLKAISDSERQQSKYILSLIESKKQKELKFSEIDNSIIQFWTKIANERESFALNFQQNILTNLEAYIPDARNKRRNLMKENEKLQKKLYSYVKRM